VGIRKDEGGRGRRNRLKYPLSRLWSYWRSAPGFPSLTASLTCSPSLAPGQEETGNICIVLYMYRQDLMGTLVTQTISLTTEMKVGSKLSCPS
jgi:hypothetical protein